MQRPREEDRADGRPKVALLGERLDSTNRADLFRETAQGEEPAYQLDGVSGAARFVEATPLGRKGRGVIEPVLKGLGGEVGGEFVDEDGSEVRVAAVAEEFPHVTVGEGGEGGDFELEEVVLVWVEVDGVDAARGLEEVVEDIVASGGDC